MSDRTSHARPPLTLVANSQEWHSRSLESILGPHGYAVLRAYTAKQAIDRAISSRPDLIILDTDLPDRDGFEVCRELRADERISVSTPIVMTSPGHSSRTKRLEALRAGAWDFIGSTLDGEELPLRLSAFVRAKQEVDRARDESLLDEATGLYNVRGLAKRAREIGSQAFRAKEPLACIVLTTQPRHGGTSPDTATNVDLERLAHVIRETGRTSDAVGMVGQGEFGVVAQGTDSLGAVRLAERLAEAANRILADVGMRVVVGFDAVPNYHDAPIEPSDMLMRASMAMRLSQTEEAGSAASVRIRQFGAQLH